MNEAFAAGMEIGATVIAGIQNRISKAIADGDDVSDAEMALHLALKDVKDELIGRVKEVGVMVAKKMVAADLPELKAVINAEALLIGMKPGCTLEDWLKKVISIVETSVH